MRGGCCCWRVSRSRRCGSVEEADAEYVNYRLPNFITLVQDAGLSDLQDYCVLQVPFLRFAITASRVFYRIALKVLFHNESDTQKHNNGQAQRSGRRVRGCKERERERESVCVCVCVFVRDPGSDS